MAQVCSRHDLPCPSPAPGNCVPPSWGGLWVSENKGRLCCELAPQGNQMTLAEGTAPQQP